MVFPYIFLLFDRFKWALIDCIEKQRVHSDLWQFQMGEGGSSSVFLISSYYLTVSNGHSLTTLLSVDFTLCSGSFKWGGGSICLWYLHVFSMHWYLLISSIILPLVSTCLLYALLFPYIFLLFDCFEWVLIDHIEKCRVHSALWQF